MSHPVKSFAHVQTT